jgi:hypothetical protein
MQIGRFLRRDQLGAKIIIGAILALAVAGWCLLAGLPLTFKSIGIIFIFCSGVVSWASTCSILWPSRCSLNTYLPYGFVLCSLASFILIMLQQGTVVSCVIGSLSGAILFSLTKVVSTQINSNKFRIAFTAKITPSSMTSLVIAILVTTFLLANQLRSIVNLNDTSVNTTINGWSDVILHANTALSLSSLALGQTPVSTLNYTDQIIPYHYASYILSSVVTSLSPQASPLAAYISIVAPFGCLLILLPLSEHFQAVNPRNATLSLLGTGSILFFVYSLWVSLIGDSLLDPAWLLMTAPATMYGCALVLSGIQIGASADQRGLASIVSLTLLTFVLTAFSKIQIAHALLPMAVMIITMAAFKIANQKVGLKSNQWMYLTLSLASLAAIHLVGNWKLGIGRKQPVAEAISFFSDIAARTWGHANFGLASIANNHWTAPLLGLMTLCGPLFLIAFISCLGKPPKDEFRAKVILLVAISYGASLLLSPSMPWDDGEFLNRSWPLLWCFGAWALLGSWPVALERLPRQLLIIISVIAMILGWLLLPEPKRESIASPPNRKDWSKSYYPTSIRLTEKKLAKALKQSRANAYFFASSNASNSNYILDDLPSRLAALSGMRPLLSRLTFQKTLPVHHARNGLNLSVETQYSQMLKRYATVCRSSAGATIPIRAFTQPELASDQRVYVVCAGLEQPSP